MDVIFGIGLVVEPLVVVSIPRQPLNKISARVSPPSAHPCPRDSTALVAIQPVNPCFPVEGIEHPKPRCDSVGPPGRLDDIVLLGESYGCFLVAGHPIRPELRQKGTVMRESWVCTCGIPAAIIKLKKLLKTCGKAENARRR